LAVLPPNDGERAAAAEQVADKDERTAAKPDAEVDEEVVYVQSLKATMYHNSVTCLYVRSMRIPISLAEAKLKYVPCHLCYPPAQMSRQERIEAIDRIASLSEPRRAEPRRDTLHKAPAKSRG
jgi:hypothetical protein